MPATTLPANDVSTLPGTLTRAVEKFSQHKGRNAEETRYFQDLYALMERHRRLGVEPASIYNMNPFPLVVNSPLFSALRVPACPSDKPFVASVLREVLYQRRDELMGPGTPIDYPPAILADEFSRRYYGVGGVVTFRGDAEAIADSQGHAVLGPMLATAKRELLETAKARKIRADENWNNRARGGQRNISNIDREYCRILIRERLVSEKPEWLDLTRDEALIAEPCPQCHAEPKKGAHVCPNCSWIIDPRLAWEKRYISDPQHEALRRLSRPALEELHISQYVAETWDEMDARLKREAEAFKRTGKRPGETLAK